MVDEHATRVKVIKEEGLDLARAPKDKLEKALHIYYEDLVETLVEALRKAISKAEKLPRTDRPLPIVLSGGTAKPRGFKELFERTLKSRAFPIEMAEVRHGQGSPHRHRARRPHRRHVREVGRGPASVPPSARSAPRAGRAVPLVVFATLPTMRRLLPALVARPGRLRRPPGPSRSGTTTTSTPATGSSPPASARRPSSSLKEAVRLKPGSGLNEVTYGLQFVDYLPYYWHGRLLPEDGRQQQRHPDVQHRGGPGRHPEEPALQGPHRQAHARPTAPSGDSMARQARSEVDRLLREAQDLARARKLRGGPRPPGPGRALARRPRPRHPARGRRGARADPGRASRSRQDAATRAQRLEQALQEAQPPPRRGQGHRGDGALRRGAGPRPAERARPRGQARGPGADPRPPPPARSSSRASATARPSSTPGEYEKALRAPDRRRGRPGNAAARDLLRAGAQDRGGHCGSRRSCRRRIDELLAEGERLLAAGKYPEAQVSFEGVLRLDPGNARAKERLELAERKTGESIFAGFLPNQAPLLTFLEPQTQRDLEAPTGGRSWGWPPTTAGWARSSSASGASWWPRRPPPAGLDAGDARRTLRFERAFPLEPGQNEITVTAIDDAGAERRESLAGHAPAALLRDRVLPALGGGRLPWASSAWASPASAYRRRRRRCSAASTPTSRAPPCWTTTCSSAAQKLLARLLNVLHHNSLMITGERRIGKTTFLYHLKKVLDADEGTEYRFFPVFTDLQGVPETPVLPRRDVRRRGGACALARHPRGPALPRRGRELRRPRLQPRPAAGASRS